MSLFNTQATTTESENERATLTAQQSVSSQGTLLHRLSQIPEEKLHLERKVGDGIFPNASMRKKEPSKLPQLLEKYVRRCISDANKPGKTVYDEYVLSVLAYYTHIHSNIEMLKREGDEQESSGSRMEEWKFAAMALDRLCLVLFTSFIVVCVSSMLFFTPYIDA